ncbi:porin [Vibrio scophthalmi]|uniref:porin n=1 Tax=Vibrio scophthalmi TaxID=45658 RepID=UPI003EC0D5AB
MKKTLVALSVLFAATSAQAIELYNQDGVTVDLVGDIEVTYQNSFSDSSMKQQIEDADFGFDARYALNDDLQFGAFWGYDGSESNNAEVTRSGDVYVALYSQTYGSIKFGRLCTAVDDLGGITSDYQFDVNKLYAAGSGDVTCADEAIRYDYDNGSFYTTLGFVQDKMGHSDLYLDEIVLDGTTIADLEGSLATKPGTDVNYYDGRFGYRVAGFDLSAFYANLDHKVDGKKDEQVYGFEVDYSGLENIRLGLGYYATDLDEKEFNDSEVYTFGADYYLGKWTFATAYSLAAEQNEKDVNSWFLNAGYNLAPNTTVYAEVAGNDGETKGRDNTTAMAIGVKASF